MQTRLSGAEEKYIIEVLRTQFRNSKNGIMVSKLEEEFARKFQVKNAIAHANGTTTLHSILEAIHVMGKEVIVPPLTMASTAFAVLHANATPVFADIDPETFLITADSIKKQITEKTCAVIIVSLYGLLPEMDKIMKVANEYELFVIEDNAQCFLGQYKGILAGKFGHASSYSFQISKHITSGEGGMVTTDNTELAAKIRKFSSLGYKDIGPRSGVITKKKIQNPKYMRHDTLGWNYRMSELNAAVALGQLERIDKLVKCRIDAANLYAEQLNGCSWLVPQKVTSYYKHSYWAWAVKLERNDISWYDFRDKYKELGGDDIYAAWQLTYMEPVFINRKLLGREKFIDSKRLNEYTKGLCPNAEAIQPKILAFKTNYWDIADAEKQAAILKKTIKYFS